MNAVLNKIGKVSLVACLAGSVVLLVTYLGYPHNLIAQSVMRLLGAIFFMLGAFDIILKYSATSDGNTITIPDSSSIFQFVNEAERIIAQEEFNPTEVEVLISEIERYAETHHLEYPPSLVRRIEEVKDRTQKRRKTR